MSSHCFIHPWLRPDESWGGFRVHGPNSAPPAAATIATLFGNPALAHIDAHLPWFIPVATLDDAEQTLSLGNDRSIILLPAAGPDAEAAALESALRQAGRRLGLLLAPGDPLPPTGVWPFVVLPIGVARTLPPYALIGLGSRSQLVITGVRNRADQAWAGANQCTLHSSEYLLARATPSDKPDLTRVKLLELLALVATDADSGEIEQIIRQETKLAYGLLRLVNSAAIAPRSPITSFSQAITLLGRRQLQRWLQLLVYAGQNNGPHTNPLLLVAATRGRLMELLAARLPQCAAIENLGDLSFMSGTFSLLDILLHLSMHDVLAQLPLPAVVDQALDCHQGPLGPLLLALSAIDSGDHDLAGEILDQLGIDGPTFCEAQVDALVWASGIRVAP